MSPVCVPCLFGNADTTRADKVGPARDDSYVPGRRSNEGARACLAGDITPLQHHRMWFLPLVLLPRRTVLRVAATGGERLGAARASVSSSRRMGDESTDGHHRFVSPLSVPGATRAEQGSSARDVSNVCGRWNAVPPRFGGNATVEAAPRLQHAGTSATTTREDIPGNMLSATLASDTATCRSARSLVSHGDQSARSHVPHTSVTAARDDRLGVSHGGELLATTHCPHLDEGTTGQDPLFSLCQRPVSPQLYVLPAPRRVAPPRTAQDNHNEFQDKLAETPS